MTPIYAARLGFDIGGIGLIMSAAIVGGALLQITIGRFSDRHDRPVVMIWVVSLAALLAAAMPFAPSHSLLLGLYFMWDGLAFSLYPLAVAQLHLVGSDGLPIYTACVFTLSGVYALYRRRRLRALVTRTAHFEPMVQSSAVVLSMMFDDVQPDLFGDPAFYEEHERQCLADMIKSW
ncbi:hypothetical protein B0H98_101601 [Vreelandella songnenensis]|uniref:MFS transporter n=1 Tax=Vreelandella songnenensis TaxID=1176243 RepID=A0A2T0V905_9GAMM|nr:hypothetical protein [Halomonas songnenensis]PRY66607.1 hypothetical protein B0H98_101601 [Halomonas songnenensis]